MSVLPAGYYLLSIRAFLPGKNHGTSDEGPLNRKQLLLYIRKHFEIIEVQYFSFFGRFIKNRLIHLLFAMDEFIFKFKPMRYLAGTITIYAVKKS